MVSYNSIVAPWIALSLSGCQSRYTTLCSILCLCPTILPITNSNPQLWFGIFWMVPFSFCYDHTQISMVVGSSPNNITSDWWFGTFGLFFHIIIGNVIILTDELTPSFFRGVGEKPPTRHDVPPWIQGDGDAPHFWSSATVADAVTTRGRNEVLRTGPCHGVWECRGWWFVMVGNWLVTVMVNHGNSSIHDMGYLWIILVLDH